MPKLTKAMAEKWFTEKYGRSHILPIAINTAKTETEPIAVTPKWELAKEDLYRNEYEVVSVPVEKIAAIKGMNIGYSLVVYRKNAEVLDVALQFFIGDETYCGGDKKFTAADYSGILVQADMSGQFKNTLAAKDGQYVGYIPNGTGKTEEYPLWLEWLFGDRYSCEGMFDGPSSGPSFSFWEVIGNAFHSIVNAVGNAFGSGDASASGSSGGDYIVNFLDYGSEDNPNDYISSNASGGGSGISSLIDENGQFIFNSWLYQETTELYFKKVRQAIIKLYGGSLDSNIEDFLISEAINMDCSEPTEDGNVVPTAELDTCVRDHIVNWLTGTLSLNTNQWYYLRANPEATAEILNFIRDTNGDQEAVWAVKSYIDLAASGIDINNIPEDILLSTVGEYVGENLNSDFACYFNLYEQIPQNEFPSISDIKRYLKKAYNVIKSKIGLAQSGFMAGAMILVDFDNLVAYSVVNCNIVNSTPILFDWITLDTRIGFKTVAGLSGTTYTWIIDMQGVISFGNPAHIGLNMSINSGEHAHHIIPKSLSTNEVVQRAARYNPDGGVPFNINDGSQNGIGIEASRHTENCNHNNYNNAVKNRLLKIYMDHFNSPTATFDLSPELAYQKLNSLITEIEFIINAHPTLHLNSQEMYDLIIAIPV